MPSGVCVCGGGECYKTPGGVIFLPLFDYLTVRPSNTFRFYHLYDAGRRRGEGYLDVPVQLRGKGLFLHESAPAGRHVDCHLWRQLI